MIVKVGDLVVVTFTHGKDKKSRTLVGKTGIIVIIDATFACAEVFLHPGEIVRFSNGKLKVINESR